MSQPPLRKPVGRKRPRRCVPHTRTFPDHAGNPVTSHVISTVGLECHLVSLQVYPLGPLVDPLAIANGLLGPELSDAYGDKFPRVDIYSPQPSLEACMAHQRAEKEHRKESDGLYMIPTWQRGRADFVTHRTNHRNLIVVIDLDCPDWDAVKAKGPGIVLFDWVGTPEDDLEVYPAEDSDAEDLEMVEAMPPGEDPLVLRGLLSREEEKMLHKDWEGMTWEDRGADRRIYFGRFFRDLSFWLPECYGGHLECEDCENEVEHERCRPEENGHRMNEETGICVTFEGPSDDEKDENDEKDEKEVSEGKEELTK
ncbi:hypothetical protein B0T14DRAFT_565084 [Immersiella caudata]|uniref:Uncharacterized protein n=1 Tax=Immersiella caudata TaxID=314043 RepID=A0AA39WYW9_9PEZI|nr:hypothetical protein B0T14DRAFT_565084 [Immersiella caudata]